MKKIFALITVATIMSGCTEMEGYEFTEGIEVEAALDKRIYVGTTGHRDIEEEKTIFEVGEKASFVIDNAQEEIGSEPVTVYYSLIDGEYENTIFTFEMEVDPSYVWLHQELGELPEPGNYVLRAYIGEEFFGEIYFEVVKAKIESLGNQDIQL